MNYMVDIETLDTRTTAIVLSAAFIQFEGKQIHKALTVYPSLVEQANRTMSLDTLRFWLEQGNGLRNLLTRQRPPLSDTRAAVFAFFDPPMTVWAKSPQFDLAMLKSLFGDVPWTFRDERCLRTLAALHPHIEFKKPNVPHDAYQDCLAQTFWAMDMLAGR